MRTHTHTNAYTQLHIYTHGINVNALMHMCACVIYYTVH